VLYRRLAPVANRWMEALGSAERYPPDLATYLARCAVHGQTRPTPLLLRYETGGYNCLHQDLYGALAFPLPVTCVLSQVGVDAVDQREERVVPPHADVRPGVHVGAALPHEDVPGPHGLAGEELDAAALSRAVATVPGAALPLLVRHQVISVTRTVVIACRWPRRRR